MGENVYIRDLVDFDVTMSTSRGKSKLEYKFQDKENSEDIFSFGSAMEEFICVVFVPDRNIFFSLCEVARATDNFSVSNKIGEGGFGPIYKGVLEDGQQVALKKLSETSQHGMDEFRNEVMCIAKL
ncbi:G-type lectin S-receptor-like serine/threonine-protein kinase [Tanacetum coccineum]